MADMIRLLLLGPKLDRCIGSPLAIGFSGAILSREGLCELI
jgi:hypothetical protein